MTDRGSLCQTLWLLLLTTILISVPVDSYATNPRNQVDFYTDSYGRLSPEEDKQVALAHRIFERLKKVAEGDARSQPRLEVVGSPGDPWAIALPDGHIVLSKGAIERCYQLADKTESCLAFILGHELAHITNNDYWHHEVSRFLASSEGTSSLARELNKNIDVELKADDYGFIYAAMAGYPVHKLLTADSEAGSFFHYWSQQTSARIPLGNTSLELRAELLKKRLRTIQEKLKFFEFGVRLAHFDYCDDAVHFFSGFQKTFPGREVLNNLGYCHLQIARQKMAPERAYFYWMPLQLDGETRAASLTQRGSQKALRLRDTEPGEASENLLQAASYLQKAIIKDPYYLPARINLAVAYLYSNQPHQARAVLDEARALAPDNHDVQALEALSIYEQSDSQINLLPNALARLRNLAKKPDASPSILFNLVQLHQQSGTTKNLGPYVQRLLSSNVQLPSVIQNQLCNAMSLSPPKSLNTQSCEEKQTTGRPSSELARYWPFSDKNWQQLTPKLRQAIAHWQRTAIDWDSQGAIYHQPDQQVSTLVMDQFIQMQIVKGTHNLHFDQLRNYCATALRRREMPTGVLLSCGNWAALTRDNRVNELWWVAR